ncbi:L,D-transpeptidase [Fodinicola acaciae]|uniref:L,D-transpeptidase n=1 Tax=Fodinicola acaciae TaxID=2681555 RepID=UPI0013D32E63|nr:L,D-transpeptidase [Fodinicola acaciae]
MNDVEKLLGDAFHAAATTAVDERRQPPKPAPVAGRRASWIAPLFVAAAAALVVVVAAVTVVPRPTATPAAGDQVRVLPPAADSYGVQMPVVLRFTEPVSAPIVNAIAVRVGGADVPGRWRWQPGNRQLLFLPRADWRPHSKVEVVAAVRGKPTGDGRTFAADLSFSMSIGARQVTTVDAAKHQLTVRSDGRVARVLPVSLGKPSAPTPRGSSVVTGKHRTKVLTGGTPGKADFYRVNVQWVVSMNDWDGAFAARWAVPDIGHRDVSAGGISLRPADAEWFFGVTQLGDLVDTPDTAGRPTSPTWPAGL